MVHAIIYTLFLGSVNLIGTTIMGLIYPQVMNNITRIILYYLQVE